MAAAITMIAAASCVQELANDAQHPEGAVVYKAIADGADTKAVLGTNESGRPQSMWEDGDNIIVYVEGGQSFRFSTTLDEPSFSADFTYDGDDFPSVQVVTAIYPDLATVSHPEYGWITAFTSTDQLIDPATDSYAKYSVPSIAYSTDNTLNFKNATSLLKFQVSKSDISKITFTAKGEEIVSGTCVYSFDSDGCINGYMASGGENYASLYTIDGKSFHPGENYYLSVLPTVLESGFVLELTDVNGIVVYTKEYDRSITLKRNVILDLGTLGEESSTESADYIDEYGINRGPGVEIDGVVWAPVNCGYHETDFKYGKLYQWGRKYGQGYDDDDATTPVIENGCISLIAGNHQDNANKFYKGNNDWLYSGYSNLWNIGTESDPVKTEYDPCPEGWRVPTYAELESLSVHHSEWTTNEYGQNGYWFCGTAEYASGVSQVFLPAAGWRNWGGGIAALRGTLADYWSSSFDINNQKPSRLAFDNSAAQMGSSAQAYGFSLRCVQADSELIPVTHISLDMTEMSLERGNFSRLKATVVPSNANHCWMVYWHSDNPDVATVDSNGSIQAISVGTAVITAIAGMQTAACKVTVKEKSDDNIETEVTTIWNGTEYINWNGMSDLAYGNFDWSGVKPGTVLTAHFTLDKTCDYWQFRIANGNWEPLPSFAEFCDDYEVVYLSQEDTSYSIVLTQADIETLCYSGLVITGCNYTLTKLTLSSKSAKEEAVIWEGEAIVENRENYPVLLSDGGAELRNAGAYPGQTLYFYLHTDDEDDWHFELWEGHWCGLYIWTDSFNYDLSANGYRIGFTLTQDILDTAYTQQWWGGTFLLSGDNLKCTKITLQ